MNQSHTHKKTAKTEDAVITGRVPRIENSTDATRGMPLAERVQARRAELADALAEVPADDLRTRDDLELALAAVDSMLTGDLDHIPDVVADDMNRWLERNKHLAEVTPVAKTGKKKTSA